MSLSIDAGFVHVNGAELYCERAGSGPPVVFLHAGICDLRMWDEQAAAFAQDFMVIRYDRRGFGRSPMPESAYSHRQDLLALLDHFGLERVTLVGCSQGGRIALDFALDSPARVERLVLVASALSGFPDTTEPPPQFALAEEAEAAGDLEALNELELQVWVDGPFRTPDQVPRALRERVREMNRIALATPKGLGDELSPPPALDRLETLRIPTLLMVGDLDTEYARLTSQTLKAHMPHAILLALSDVAHLPNMEQPQHFNAAAMKFLR